MVLDFSASNDINGQVKILDETKPIIDGMGGWQIFFGQTDIVKEHTVAVLVWINSF